MFFMFLMAAFIFFPFFAPSLPVLLVGQILEGIPWGVFQVRLLVLVPLTCARLSPWLSPRSSLGCFSSDLHHRLRQRGLPHRSASLLDDLG